MKLYILSILSIYIISCNFNDDSITKKSIITEKIEKEEVVPIVNPICNTDSVASNQEIDSFELFIKSFSEMNKINFYYYHYLDEKIPTNEFFFELYSSDTKPIKLNKINAYFYYNIVFGVCSEGYIVIFDENNKLLNKEQLSKECDFDLSQPTHHSQTYEIIDSNAIEIIKTRYYYDSLKLKNIDPIKWEYSEEIFFID